jgi:hypothetical protein
MGKLIFAYLNLDFRLGAATRLDEDGSCNTDTVKRLIQGQRS